MHSVLLPGTGWRHFWWRCESLVLSIAGGVMGAAVGALGIATIKVWATVEAPGIFRLAVYLPARRAMRVDPAVALRAE